MTELNNKEKRQITKNVAEQFHKLAKELYFDVSPLSINKKHNEVDCRFTAAGIEMQFMMFREGR